MGKNKENMEDFLQWIGEIDKTLANSFQVDDGTAKRVLQVWGNSDQVIAVMKEWLETRDFMGFSFEVMLTPQERTETLDYLRVATTRSKSAMDFFYMVPLILSGNTPW